jgi:hypothetical protein
VSKPTHIARYYADDKDVLDLLSQSAVSLKELRKFLRTRGIILSPSLTKDQICRYLQTSPLSWPQLEALLEIVETPGREDKFSTCRLDATNLTSQSVVTAAAAVQANRGARHGEIYKIQANNDGTVEIVVDYTEPNFSKTRCLQHQAKDLTVRIEREDDQFRVRYHENARALEIVAALEQSLTPASKIPPKRQEIVVSGLTSIQRSKFFVEMARGIEGYELKDERGLQVDRPLDGDPDEEGEDSEDSDEETDFGDEDAAPAAAVAASVPVPSSKSDSKATKAQFQGLVKRALLHGTGLLMSPQYQDYAKAGYSLSKLIWTVESKSADGPMVEFGAEFRDGERGAGFRYGVLGKYERHEDGTFAKSRKSVTGVEKNTLLALLETSAYSALADLQEEVSSAASPLTPPVPPVPSAPAPQLV